MAVAVARTEAVGAGPGEAAPLRGASAAAGADQETQQRARMGGGPLQAHTLLTPTMQHGVWVHRCSAAPGHCRCSLKTLHISKRCRWLTSHGMTRADICREAPGELFLLGSHCPRSSGTGLLPPHSSAGNLSLQLERGSPITLAAGECAAEPDSHRLGLGLLQRLAGPLYAVPRLAELGAGLALGVPARQRTPSAGGLDVNKREGSSPTHVNKQGEAHRV